MTRLSAIKIACYDSLDPLFKTLRVWIQGLGAIGTYVISDLFLKLLEDKDIRLKIELTLRLILRISLRLRGYAIWSGSLIASYIKEDLTTTRGMSTSQSQRSQGNTRKTPSR
jgi:hypothetical protein